MAAETTSMIEENERLWEIGVADVPAIREENTRLLKMAVDTAEITRKVIDYMKFQRPMQQPCMRKTSYITQDGNSHYARKVLDFDALHIVYF